MNIVTFRLQYAYTSFKPLQPYLDTPLISLPAMKIGTLIEYRPGEFGLIAGFLFYRFRVRQVEDIRFYALNNAQRIELEPVIICASSNLMILKPKRPEELREFHPYAAKLPSSLSAFALKDNATLTLYQKNFDTLNDVGTKVNAKRFRFDEAFCFSLSQKTKEKSPLSCPGPLVDENGMLVGYMIHPTDSKIISSFHLQHLINVLATGKQECLIRYPFIDIELIDLTPDNYHLYLPKDAIDEKNGAYGCSIQNCPTYPDYPFKRGDILIAMNDQKIYRQHIKVPDLGLISLKAAAFLSPNATLNVTLYRQGKKLTLEIEKTLFSQLHHRMKDDLEFIIMNGVVFQTANISFYDHLIYKSNSNSNSNSNHLNPNNNHHLAKAYGYAKYQEKEAIVLIQEALTHTTLFDDKGASFEPSATQPFIVQKLNGQRIIDLTTFIQKMQEIPIGKHYTLEGAKNNTSCQIFGIKISDEENETIMHAGNITRKCSENIARQLPSLALNNVLPPPPPTCLYSYGEKNVSQTSFPHLLNKNATPTEFLLATAIERGVVFIHATIKRRNSVQPYQYDQDQIGTSSGFIVQHKGKNYIITCAHCTGYTVEAQIEAKFPSNATNFNLKVLMIDNIHDIAILEVHDEQKIAFDTIAYPFYVDNAALFPKKQSDILVIGFPGGSVGELTQPKVQGGKVTAIGYYNLGRGRSHQYVLSIQTNALIRNGNSGGPIIDAKTGALIGINSHSFNTEVSQVSAFSAPIIFLIKMLKKLEKSNHYPCYPDLIGAPFALATIASRQLKIAHGIAPDSDMGAKVSALYANLPELRVNDILLELIDKNGNIYPVDGKTTLSIEGNDISFHAFFELQEIGDPISMKVLRDGQEHVIKTHIDPSWPFSPKICSGRKDSNQIAYLEFCQKLIIANFDLESVQVPSSNFSLIHYKKKCQKQDRSKSTKVFVLEILSSAYKELSPWLAKNDKNELLFINKINGTPVYTIQDVQNIASDPKVEVFELECKSSKCNTKDERFIFKITRNSAPTQKTTLSL